VEGEVVVELVISKEGKVLSVSPVSFTHPGFITSAVEIAQKIRFRPARRGEEPVPVKIRLPIRFVLR
jgi:TonB family protein